MSLIWTKYLPEFLRDKLEGRESLQKGLHNTAWMMGDQVVRKLAGLLVWVLLARHFGPQLFGDYSYAIALVLIISPLAVLSLDAIAIRQLVKDPSQRDEIIGTSFILMLVGGGVAYVLAMVTIFVIRPDGQLVHWLVGIMSAGIVAQAFIAIEFWFESQMQWQFTVYAKTSAFLLLSLVKVGLVLANASLIAIAWAGLAESVLGSVGLLLAYRYRGFSVKAWRFSRDMVKTLLSDSWPLMFSALLTMVYMRIDQIMLGNMAGSTELGNYSVAVQLSEAWYFIPMVIASSVMPAFVEVEKDNEDLFYAHLQRLYRIMALYSYLIAVPITFFAKDIVLFLFSSAYADAGPLAAIMIWVGVFTSLGAARNILILVKNWTRIHLLSMALGCLLNILLNLLLIPRYGAMGAVVATFASYWFAIHGSCLLMKPLRKTGWMMIKAMVYPKVW